MKTGKSLLRPTRPFGAAWQNTSLLDGDGNASKICASREQLGISIAVADLRDWKELALFEKRLSGRAAVFCAQRYCRTLRAAASASWAVNVGGEEERRV
jgi:hypothetical protein